MIGSVAKSFSAPSRVYMSSGACQHPPQPTIRSTKIGLCSFIKEGNLSGAFGLLTYDLYHTSTQACTERIAIMFSVPYDYNLHDNQLALGVFEQSRECNKKLYDHMCEGKDFSNFIRSKKSGAGLEYEAQRIDLRATMSSIGKAIVKVELYDKLG